MDYDRTTRAYLLGFWLVSILEGARCARRSDMYHVFVHQEDETKVEA